MIIGGNSIRYEGKERQSRDVSGCGDESKEQHRAKKKNKRPNSRNEGQDAAENDEDGECEGTEVRHD